MACHSLLMNRFLLAQFHIELLARKHNPRDVKNALKTLPEKLQDSYGEIINRICGQDPEDVELAKRVLVWISYAKRPLKSAELQEALSVTPDSTELDESAFTDEDLLVSVCAGIITIDQESSIIRFVHYTAQEYLEKTRERLLPDAQVMIATTCLRYLGFPVFSKPCRVVKGLYGRLQTYKFNEYAAQYWAYHTRGNPEENDSVQTMVIETFLQLPGRFESMNEIREHLLRPWSDLRTRQTLLHVIAEEGLCFLFRKREYMYEYFAFNQLMAVLIGNWKDGCLR